MCRGEYFTYLDSGCSGSRKSPGAKSPGKWLGPSGVPCFSSSSPLPGVAGAQRSKELGRSRRGVAAVAHGPACPGWWHPSCSRLQSNPVGRESVWQSKTSGRFPLGKREIAAQGRALLTQRADGEGGGGSTWGRGIPLGALPLLLCRRMLLHSLFNGITRRGGGEACCSSHSGHLESGSPLFSVCPWIRPAEGESLCSQAEQHHRSCSRLGSSLGPADGWLASWYLLGFLTVQPQIPCLMLECSPGSCA